MGTIDFFHTWFPSEDGGSYLFSFDNYKATHLNVYLSIGTYLNFYSIDLIGLSTEFEEAEQFWGEYIWVCYQASPGYIYEEFNHSKALSVKWARM